MYARCMELAAKRELLRELALAVLADLAPGRLIAAQCRRVGGELHVDDRAWPLDRPILVLAYGKAAVPMARAMEPLLHGAGPLALIVSAPERFLAPGQNPAPWGAVQSFVGGHPEPNEASVAAAHAMLAAVAAAPGGSLIVHLVSGGGSALLEAPLRAELSAADLRAAYGALVRNGAPIHEVNALRKHLSAVKGGRLAAAAPASADQLSLILSDVPGGDLSSVASGPSLPDPSTVADCRAMLAAHPTPLPPAIARLLAHLPETPKPGDRAFARSAWHLLLDDRGAAARLRARPRRRLRPHPRSCRRRMGLPRRRRLLGRTHSRIEARSAARLPDRRRRGPRRLERPRRPRRTQPDVRAGMRPVDRRRAALRPQPRHRRH